MTIRLTKDEFNEQFQEAGEELLQQDLSDQLDTTYKFDARITQGWRRKILLRDSMWLSIDRHKQTEPIVLDAQERKLSWLGISFILSGEGQRVYNAGPSETLTYSAGKYLLRSNGILPSHTDSDSDTESAHFLYIEVSPFVLRSFLGSPEQELSKHLQHLVKVPDVRGYARYSDTQPVMNMVLQQILHCSYQGMIKRAYLESKVIELIALVLDHETAIQQGEIKEGKLKPEQLERIHYAKEILLSSMSNPPSLEDLARQSGLNELLLRKGFRQAFDTTVFELLRSHRFDLAKQLLAEQDLNIGEVALRVGYASVSHFSKAFEQKYGIRPKAYQKKCR